MTHETVVSGLEPRVAECLHALSDENRLRVVDALRLGERCVCQLTEGLGISQSLLSHHLRVLREAGLVSDRREGRWVHYSLVPGALGELERFFGDLRDGALTGESHLTGCE
jgi:ArsR family transcriptional regulator